MAAIAILASGGLFFLLSRPGESSPQEAQNWFETIVHEDASAFNDIQHYTDQGIDFSHHFRFRFNAIDDLTVLIKKHDLTRNPNAEPIQTFGLPPWYTPSEVPEDAPKFERHGSEPILLFIDPAKNVAYFEFLHL
ncbi:hypothetical protein [Rhodopirellula bahusiensis]|uniref:hypothetical protein n=1 Tax=Rhodopirellula bahusiensis TaxID=2014065 RepID=UPI00130455C7|nr:hypothetical protein [Rhodopirellula bahusiensis]